MIQSLSHADACQRHIQSHYNAREIASKVTVDLGLSRYLGAPVTWPPTGDPHEIVRRQEILEHLLPELGHDGNVLHASLSQYCKSLAVELAFKQGA